MHDHAPLAPRVSSRAESSGSPTRHCQMALCSLSTGRMRIPLRRASPVTISPAMTNASLLARATSLPASSAARVGAKPACPVVATTTRSTSGCVASATIPSSPASIGGPSSAGTEAAASLSSSASSKGGSGKAAACASNPSRSRPAPRATTRIASKLPHHVKCLRADGACRTEEGYISRGRIVFQYMAPERVETNEPICRVILNEVKNLNLPKQDSIL